MPTRLQGPAPCHHVRRSSRDPQARKHEQPAQGSGVAGNARPMRAAGIETFGGEVQMLELAAPQSLAPDEIVIAVRAAGVGNWDEIVRGGGWDVGRQPPLVLGVEAAGAVVAVGEAVASPAPGEGVPPHPLPLRPQAPWGERWVAPAALVARKPDAVPW